MKCFKVYYNWEDEDVVGEKLSLDDYVYADNKKSAIQIGIDMICEEIKFNCPFLKPVIQNNFIRLCDGSGEVLCCYCKFSAKEI